MGVQMDGLTMDEWMDGWINSWMEEKEIRNVDAKNKRNKATLEIERQSKSMTLDMEAIDLPCDATLSRATYKIDLMHMVLRRQQWANRLRAQEKHFVQLSS